MRRDKYKILNFRHYDYLIVTILFLISFWIEKHLFINWDVGWHIEGAKRMLHGDTYTKNIFDDNPPMVFWFYMPSIFLHELTGISLNTLYIFNIQSIVLISFIFCNSCLKNIYSQSTFPEIELARYTLLFAFLFIPASIFGSREMLLTLFILPYVILTTETIYNDFHQRVSIYFRGLLGLWMGIGIALNPFYVLIPIALELQYWFYAKKLVFWRSEFITFTLFFFCYLICIKVFYSDYYTVIIPAFFAFSSGFNVPFHKIFFAFPTQIIIVCSFIYTLLCLMRYQKSWITTLWLCTVLSYVIYVSNKKTWFFHYIPELIFGCLLCSAILGHFIFSFKKDKHIKMLFICFSLLGLSTFPLLFINMFMSGYTKYADLQDARWQLISYFNQHSKNATIYSFSPSMYPIFLILNYTSLQPLVPWPGCWQLPMIIQSEKTHDMQKHQYEKIQKYKSELLSQVANDINLKKPDYVIVDIEKHNELLGSVNFDFIDFFKENKTFKTAWKHYHLEKIISHFEIYRIRK